MLREFYISVIWFNLKSKLIFGILDTSCLAYTISVEVWFWLENLKMNWSFFLEDLLSPIWPSFSSEFQRGHRGPWDWVWKSIPNMNILRLVLFIVRKPSSLALFSSDVKLMSQYNKNYNEIGATYGPYRRETTLQQKQKTVPQIFACSLSAVSNGEVIITHYISFKI